VREKAQRQKEKEKSKGNIDNRKEDKVKKETSAVKRQNTLM